MTDTTTPDQDPQQLLGQLVENQSDDEIRALVLAAGTDTLLDQIFEGMQQRFQADKAAGQEAVVQWDITDPDEPRRYQVVVSGGTCRVDKAGEATPRVTLGLSLPDFLRFVAGKLDGMQAFMSGKLKITGDLMLAQTMQAWFGQ